MALEKICKVEGKGVYVPGNDIDTDRIIPARFMVCVTFEGLGKYAFYDERKNADGSDKKHPLTELRLRLVARARPAGPAPLRVQGGHSRKLRRNLLRQLDDAWHTLRVRDIFGHRRNRQAR